MTTPAQIPRPPSPERDRPDEHDGSRTHAAVVRRWWAIAAAAVLLAATIAVIALRAGDDDAAPPSSPTTSAMTAPSTAPSTAAPTTAAPTSPSTATPTSTPADLSAALWPAAGSDRTFTDPLAVTRAFALEYLGFVDPVIGPFRQGDTRSGEVDIRPRAPGPVTGTMVRQLDAAGHWYVLGANTDTIDVTTPAWNAEVGSPVAVAGRALAFEGTVNIEVRRDGQTRPVGQGFVTGGGSEMMPFSGQVTYTADPGPGALVFLELSAENGSITKATVVRVQLRGDS
jgi:hypothetical protein